MFEKTPGADVSGAGGTGNDTKPGGDDTPPTPPAGGDQKPEDVIPKARFEEVIAERNELRDQVKTLGSNLNQVLERVNELSGQGKTEEEIAEIVSEEAKEWNNSKGFNEAVAATVKTILKKELGSVNSKIDNTLQMQARIILDDFKEKHPDFDENNPEVVKRLKAGYTLKDTYKIVFGNKTLGKPGDGKGDGKDNGKGDDKKPPAPPHKPGPQDDKLKTPKTPISLKESFRKAVKALGLQEGGAFPRE